MQGAKRLFFAQLSLVLMLSVWVCITRSRADAASLFLGGITWLLPQVMFAQQLFKDARARFAKLSLQRAYRAEASKLAFSAILFAVVFRFIKVEPLPFFLGYLMVYSTNWFAPWFFKQAKRT